MNTRRAIELVVMGVRGCSMCEGSGLVAVSPEAPTGDCPRCREPGYKYRASGRDPDSHAEVNAAIAHLEADARALWAYRVIERHCLITASYSGDLSRHEALLHERATALVAADPSLDPDAPRGATQAEHDAMLLQSYGPPTTKAGHK